MRGTHAGSFSGMFGAYTRARGGFLDVGKERKVWYLMKMELKSRLHLGSPFTKLGRGGPGVNWTGAENGFTLVLYSMAHEP